MSIKKDSSIFNYDDVLKVAKALLSDYAEYDGRDYGSDRYECNYCDGESKRFADSQYEIKHDVNCPTLVATDLLTRSK